MKAFISMWLTIACCYSTAEAQWVQNTDIAPYWATSFAAAGSDLYASTYGSGAFRSTDDGISWVAIDNGLPDGSLSQIWAKPFNLIAATKAGICRSDNRGESWKLVSDIVSVTTSVTSNGSLFFGTFSRGVFRSRDDGLTWDSLKDGLLPDGKIVLCLGMRGTEVIAGTGSGLYSFSDVDSKWHRFVTKSGLPSAEIKAFAASEKMFYVQAGQSQYRSTDSGANWTRINVGYPYVTSVRRFLVSGTQLIAGADLGLFLSNDSGINWTKVDDEITAPAIGCMALLGQNFYVGTDADGVWRRPFAEVLGTSGVSRQALDHREVRSYPNPFSQSTTIAFTSDAGNAQISVVNLFGVEVARIFDGRLDEGEHRFVWTKPVGLPNGTYNCIVRMNDRLEKLPLLLLQ